MRRTLLPIAAAAALLLSACSGGGAENPAEPEPTTTAEAPAPEPEEPTPSAEPAQDLPPLENIWDLAPVCDGEGHPDAATYDPSSGPRPVVAFDRTGSGKWSRAIKSPLDWFDDKDPAAIQIMACVETGEATPNGTTCDFQDTDGNTVTLELRDVVYEVAVRATQTGEVLEEHTVEAASTTCPLAAAYDPDDLVYDNTIGEDEYRELLADYRGE